MMHHNLQKFAQVPLIEQDPAAAYISILSSQGMQQPGNPANTEFLQLIPMVQKQAADSSLPS